MFCHQCGAPVLEGAKFCAKCGVSLTVATAENPPAFTPTPTPEASPTTTDATRPLHTTPPSELADRSTRLGACVLDFILFLASLVPGLMVMSAADSDGGKGFGVALVAIGWLGLMVVQMVFLLKHGQSLGKRFLKIRIVRVSDERIPSFMKVVLLRLWVPSLLGGIPVVGTFFWLLDGLFIFRDDKRCLHDLIAETKVVKA